MIPLRDTIPSRTYPVVNVILIVINSLAFLYEVSIGNYYLGRFIATYGVVPLRYFYITDKTPFDIVGRFLPFLTSMFLHGGWLHVIGNMLYLWIFGDNVEDRMGHFRYLFFYLICGILAGFAHVYTNSASRVPTVGASGAIAGVMGAYFILYPRARIVALVPIFIFLQIVYVPAILFLGFWFLLQFFSGAFSLAAGGAAYGGIAWWTHIGGFVSGAVLVFLFKKRRKLYYRSYNDGTWREL